MYSNPPLHGALLVKTILQDGALRAQWFNVRAARAAARGDAGGMGSRAQRCAPRGQAPPPSPRRAPAQEVRAMAERIIAMRQLLRANLEQLGSKHSWAHVTDQIGMFAFSGMTPGARTRGAPRGARGGARGRAGAHGARRRPPPPAAEPRPPPPPAPPPPGPPSPRPPRPRTAEMVDELAGRHSIYMTRNGRISMAGVNSRNVARLAAAMHEVTK